MKMNNKYLSRLLAGVLTAGVVQGSGNEGKMPGLGEKQTPVVRAQTANELPADLQELLLVFSQSLAERGYRAQIDLSAIQMPTQITSVNTSALNGNDRTQGDEGTFDLPEMIIPEPQGSSVSVERTDKNGESKQAANTKQTAPKKQLDPYHMQVVSEHLKSARDLHNATMVNSKYKELANRNRMNFVPVTEKNQVLFEYIQTQQIFGPNDYIIPNVDKYIFKYSIPISVVLEKNDYFDLNNKYPNSVFEEVKVYSDVDGCSKHLQKDNIRFFELIPGVFNSTPIPIEWFSLPKIKSIEGRSNVLLPDLEVFCTWKSLDHALKKCSLKSFYGCNLTNVKNLNPAISKIYLPFVLSKNWGLDDLHNVDEVWVPYNFDLERFSTDNRSKIRRYTAGQLKVIQKERMEFFKYVKDFKLKHLLPYVNYTEKPEKLDKGTWRQVENLKKEVEKLKAAMRGEVRLNDGSMLARLESMNPAYTLRDVRGDGNCGIYAVLQALHPEQNYLNVQANDKRWNEAQNLRNVLPEGHPGREMAQNAGDLARWIEDSDFQHFAQHLGRSILFISERGQIIEYNRNANMHIYNSLEEAFQQKAQGAIIIYHNGVDHFQTIIPMPNA